MTFAADWVAVMALLVSLVSAFFSWKALGPRRKTKISLLLDLDETFTFNETDGYRRVILKNDGHFPAHGTTVELTPDSSSLGGHSIVGVDLAPWGTEYTEVALRGFENMKFPVTYIDANNKLTKTRVKIETGHIWSDVEKKKITGWIDKAGTWGSKSANWD